jgi:transposase
MATKAWNDERTAELTGLVGDINAEVSQDQVKEAAETLEVTPRSVGAKLRKMGYTVEKASDAAKSKWSDNEEAGLRQLLTEQEGRMTYAEIAAAFNGGKFSAKAVQGKILSMEMTGMVKPTPKAEVQRTYTPEEETTFIAMAGEGASIEAIAEKLGKSINSVRGKALSLSRQVEGFVIPTQASSHASVKVDPVEALGSGITKMTVAEIADKIEKTERGVKTLLTRRGITCADYDGAKKAAKNAEKAKS